MDILEQQGIRIDLPLISLSKRKVHSVKECHLTLYPQYLTYKVIAKYELKNDDTDIWENKSSNYRYTQRKSNLSNVEMVNDSSEDGLYYVSVQFGNNESVGSTWYFDNPKTALEIYNQLQKYMITGL